MRKTDSKDTARATSSQPQGHAKQYKPPTTASSFDHVPQPTLFIVKTIHFLRVLCTDLLLFIPSRSADQLHAELFVALFVSRTTSQRFVSCPVAAFDDFLNVFHRGGDLIERDPGKKYQNITGT